MLGDKSENRATVLCPFLSVSMPNRVAISVKTSSTVFNCFGTGGANASPQKGQLVRLLDILGGTVHSALQLEHFILTSYLRNFAYMF